MLHNPTLRKLKNRGLTPIRYHSPDGFYHGWVVERMPRGGMRLQLVGQDRITKLTADEAKYVTELLCE